MCYLALNETEGWLYIYSGLEIIFREQFCIV
jgi:hypothetical protein